MNPKILEYLSVIYEEDELVEDVHGRLAGMLDMYASRLVGEEREAYFDEQDAILITYGDMVQAEGERPLVTLRRFLEEQVGGLVAGVHLLPFFPYSSDDGFAVIDYDRVDPQLGSWADVEAFDEQFKLMFDAVINHISRESAWFQAYLRGEEPYTDYFVEVAPGTDLTAVFRPRALPLLTRVATSRGEKWVWTTFSDDQIDLNYASPDLLLDILRVLLNYVAHGAVFIRLDAIAFMWKEVGTDCIHRPKTHALIQLMRAVLDEVAPQVVLITETNVPHEENISYFGDGHNEAQMVYNFSLPPLTLHAFHTGQAETLSRWASTLKQHTDEVTFFNFLASHDGIGLTPARRLLDDGAIQAMAKRVEALGGFVSYKSNADGSQSAYELNINYLDGLGDPQKEEETDALATKRFLASQAIMLAIRGVPGIYFHSLFGSRSWPEGVKETGRARTINRQKLQRETLESELAQQGSLRQLVFEGYQRLLQARTGSQAFHPNGGQEILALNPALFAVRRTSPDGSKAILCVQNVSNEAVEFVLDDAVYDDLLSGQEVDGRAVLVEPYGVIWLQKADAFVTKEGTAVDLEHLEIAGERVHLRPIVEADAAPIFEFFDKNVTRYMTPQPAEAIEETEAVIKRWRVGMRRGDNVVFAITLKESGEFLGTVGLHGQGKLNTPELGIWTKTAAHGHRYGREAISTLVAWAERNLVYDYLTYPVDRANIPSRKIPETLGGEVFREEESPEPDGRVLDIVWYRIYPGQA